MDFLPQKIDNMLWEFRLRITTRGLTKENTSDTEHIHYGTIPYRMLTTILDHATLTPQDVFVDLGCGKGRVVCVASLRDIKKSIGVEYSESLANVARSNAARVKGRLAPIEIVTSDVIYFNYTVGTIFYLFHPFGPETLKQVLDALHAGVQARPRRIRIIYVNSVHEEILRHTSWLKEYDRWEIGNSKSSEHLITWWHNRIDPV